MPALPDPHAEDLLIRRDSTDAFTLGGSGGAPQIACRTFEEALQRAGGFANQQHVRLWYTADGLLRTPLGDVTLLRRIWREYTEMPGLRLTCAQARRLWGLDVETCTSLLKTLVELRFLMRRADGTYARFFDVAAALPPPQMSKADHVVPRAAHTSRQTC